MTYGITHYDIIMTYAIHYNDSIESSGCVTSVIHHWLLGFYSQVGESENSYFIRKQTSLFSLGKQNISNSKKTKCDTSRRSSGSQVGQSEISS